MNGPALNVDNDKSKNGKNCAKILLRNVLRDREKCSGSSDEENPRRCIVDLKMWPEDWKAKLWSARMIALYMPIRDELSLEPLIDELQGRVRFCFPKVEGEDISFYEASESSDFVSGSYSILEPRENLRKVAPEEIDVILIPATAYGCDGTRLGRGKGYYDRFCSTFSNICGTIKQKSRIGVVPHECFMGRIPCDPWDLKVDAVLTDKVFQVLPVLEKEIEER